MHNTLRMIVMTAVAALATGCTQTVVPPQPPVDPETCTERCDDPPTKQAIADFDAAVARYRAATASGELSEQQCDALASAFADVYKQHGAGMAIAQFNAGAVRERCGQLDEAAKIYSALIKSVPDFGLAYNNLGVIEWERGQQRAAMDHFRSAVAKDKLRALAARNNVSGLAREAYVRTVDRQAFEEAERSIQEVLALDSSNQRAYENLARLYYDRGRLQEQSYTVLANLVVQQGLRVIKEQGRESAELLNVKGLLVLDRGDQVAALKAFEEAARIEPGHVEANLNIAFIAIRFRNYEKAARSFELAFKDAQQRQNLEAQLGYGVALRGLKRFDEAKRAYLAAAKIDPDDPRAQFNLGVLNQDHVASDGEVSNAKTAKYFTIAEQHFQRFLEIAGKRAEYKTEVLEARDRLASIDETREIIRNAEIIEEEIKRLNAQAAAEREAEITRLKELEERALAAEREAARGGE
ncbi:MAG: tetratricopeptide repeat protein [Myxococcales bacterium]|nr:tetratricopeptide repeat protein [Myxococcales bacterium]